MLMAGFNLYSKTKIPDVCIIPINIETNNA